MRKILFVLSFILLSSLARAGEVKYGVGLGHTYGGLGAQVALIDSKSKYRASAGFLGAGIGYERYISRKSTLGLSYTRALFIDELGTVDWTYYFSEKPYSGFNLAVSAGVLNDTGDRGNESIATIAIGYAF